MPLERSTKPRTATKGSAASLARENAALRARLTEYERELSARLDTDLPSITRDLSALIGRALLAARDGTPSCHEAARALEAVREALYSPRSQVVRALGAAADRINMAISGKQRATVPKRDEDGPVAEQVRDLFANWLIRPLRLDAAGLGVALYVCARMVIADRILPRVGTAEETAALYSRAIAEVLETHARRSPEALAEMSIVACAKASGVRRPSRLFDAVAKRERSRAEGAVDNACGTPPGVVRTAPKAAEDRAKPIARLPNGPGAAPDVSARPTSRGEPVRRGDDRKMVDRSRKR